MDNWRCLAVRLVPEDTRGRKDKIMSPILAHLQSFVNHLIFFILRRKAVSTNNDDTDTAFCTAFFRFLFSSERDILSLAVAFSFTFSGGQQNGEYMTRHRHDDLCALLAETSPSHSAATARSKQHNAV